MAPIPWAIRRRSSAPCSLPIPPCGRAPSSRSGRGSELPATERPILAAGGGPVGCIAALALARQGIPVHVLEAEARVDDSPRAATTHAATLEMLAELGLVDEVIRRGLIEPKFRIWDRASQIGRAHV